MKTDKEMMQDVIMYAYNLAKGNSDYSDCTILTGNKVNKIEEHAARSYLQNIDASLRQIIQQLEDAHANGTYEDNKLNAFSLFQYVFDWTTEAFYYCIIDDHDKDVYVNIEEALEEIEYNYSIPGHIKSKVDEIVREITSLSNRIYQYIREDVYTDLPLSKWLYLYLSAASTIAEQFLLEQDLKE